MGGSQEINIDSAVSADALILAGASGTSSSVEPFSINNLIEIFVKENKFSVLRTVHRNAVQSITTRRESQNTNGIIRGLQETMQIRFHVRRSLHFAGGELDC